MTYQILVSIFCAEQRKAKDHEPTVYRNFAAVSELSDRFSSSAQQLFDLGLSVFSEELPIRKAVEIELPDDVSDGEYLIANVTKDGLHSNFYGTDGNGSAVYISCGDPALVKGYDYDTAIDQAIASGIYLSVPRKSGRETVRVKVVRVGELERH